MGRTSDYGDQYLCIRLKNNEDIYVYADQADIVDGAIRVKQQDGTKKFDDCPRAMGKAVMSSHAPIVRLWRLELGASTRRRAPLDQGGGMTGSSCRVTPLGRPYRTT